MQLSKFEKIVIIIVLLVGLIGGVVLVFLQAPPIVSSIFIAMGIATLVYHFLGGINNSELNTGIIKLGGSMAALVGSAILINNLLIEQVHSSKDLLSINSHYEVFDEGKKPIGKLPMNEFQLAISNSLHVIASDSIVIGKLKFDNLKLEETLHIVNNDSTLLGYLNANQLKQIGLLDNLELENYTEIKYDIQFIKPFGVKCDTKGSNWVNNYRSIYMDLPFEVKPIETEDGNFKTKIRFKTMDEYELLSMRNGATKVITKFYGKESKLYLIRIRQLDQSNDWNSYGNFVQYQICEFIGRVGPHN